MCSAGITLFFSGQILSYFHGCVDILAIFGNSDTVFSQLQPPPEIQPPGRTYNMGAYGEIRHFWTFETIEPPG